MSFIDLETHNNELKRSKLEENDILFTIAGATIGKCVFVPKKLIPANTNQALAIVRLKEEVNREYIMQILRSKMMTEYIKMCAKGSAQPNLNLKQLNDFRIPIPSNDEQNHIVSLLSKFEKLTNDLTEGLPAEIKARRQQYEYYRDKLLSFNKIAS